MNIWKSYMWTAVWRIKWRHESSHFCSCEKKAWKKFGLVRDSNPWPLRYRCSALSQLGAGRCDLSTDMKFYLFMIKKRTSLYFKSSIFSHNFTSKHRTDNLLCFYTLVKAQEAQFLTACFFAECLQLVMKLECHGTRRHYMVANLQNNFEAKHFNLKSLVADLFVSLAW